MACCLISLGANLGEPASAINEATELLRASFQCARQDIRLSSLYRTPAVGGPSGQPPFVNAVARIETKQSPWEAWHTVRRIESQLGRVRQRRWEARRIDLDILLYDAQRIWTPQLKIPHPRMCMRRFILLPAQEIAPASIDPVSGQSISQLASRLTTGAGSLVVVAPEHLRPESLVGEACQLAGAAFCNASWRDKHHIEISAPAAAGDHPSRWAACLATRGDPNEQTMKLIPPPKLTVFLADLVPDGVSWEDFHNPLANVLGLLESSSECRAIDSLASPVYLLPSGDRTWAVHEMVAAFDAMDCPIERI